MKRFYCERTEGPRSNDQPNKALLDRIDELQDFYDYSPVGYLTLDRKGQILKANLTAVMMLDGTRSELCGQSLYTCVAEKDRDILYLHLRRLFIQKRPLICELQMMRKGRNSFVSLNSMFATTREGLSVVRTILTDITDHKEAEEKLRESEERLRLAVEGAGLGTWDRDLLTDKIVWNRRLYDLLGRDPSGPVVTGETFFTYIHKDDLRRVREHFWEALRAKREFRDEFRIVREDGEIRWLATSGRIYRDQAGQPVRVAGVNFDMTNRRRAEEQLQQFTRGLEQLVLDRTAALDERTRELEEMNKRLGREIDTRRRFEADLKAKGERLLQEYERRRVLSRRLVELLERDRQEVARTLHDEIGQMLTTISSDLESIKANPEGDPEALIDRLDKALNRVKGSTGHVRDISRRLRPDILDHIGLIPAIRNLLREIEESSAAKVHFFVKGLPRQIQAGKELTIYRIVQESLTNALRHARAKNIFVNLIKRGNCMVLTIEDDGVGFECSGISASSDRDHTLGIMIMNERAAQVDGDFRIESQSGKGTQVLAEIPV